MLLFSQILKSDYDVATVRQRSRELAALLGFDGGDQTRVAAAVSEIARNAVNYGQRGKAEFSLEGQRAAQSLVICISDQGPGIGDLENLLIGDSPSADRGLGLVSAQRLMDQFEIESAAGRGTTVRMRKRLPNDKFLDKEEAGRLAARLAQERPHSVAEEFQQQNLELLQTLEELQRRQQELMQLNRELEDTNRGVLALYAELDDQARRLREADQLKSRFLSHLSHEFRTPLTAIAGLTQLLLSRSDGELVAEQEKQVLYIRRAAGGLLEMVNDLLDLAKVEAGKLTVHPTRFDVEDIFSALRGLTRPLQNNPDLTVIFHPPPADMPPFYTDEGKVSQILHNLLSNAFKFTEKGSVQTSASLAPGGQAAVFHVSDTGIGIAPEDLEHIFQEFGQLDHPIQQQVRGTGLGLSLSRKLAELLGGTLTVRSELGVGSTFSATIPFLHPVAPSDEDFILASGLMPPRIATVLLVDDEEVSHYLMSNYLADSAYNLIGARDGLEGLILARREKPDIVFLDLAMPATSGFVFLEELRHDPATQDIPVVVLTSKRLTAEEEVFLAPRTTAILSKERAAREIILHHIGEVVQDGKQESA